MLIHVHSHRLGQIMKKTDYFEHSKTFIIRLSLITEQITELCRRCVGPSRLDRLRAQFHVDVHRTKLCHKELEYVRNLHCADVRGVLAQATRRLAARHLLVAGVLDDSGNRSQ